MEKYFYISLFLMYIINNGSIAINETILSYTVNPQQENVQFFWQDNEGQPIKSLANLKKYVEQNNQILVFGMNGGMFTKELAPQGLFIQHRKTIVPLDTISGAGNFYLKPNGVFYLTQERKAFVQQTADFRPDQSIVYATQSGPMLVINGKIHAAFRQGSTNLNIRNGVGITADNQILFAISTEKINLYDFAKFFQDNGCQNALYLDGYVSRAYIPSKNWNQLDGKFGVMIGIIK